MAVDLSTLLAPRIAQDVVEIDGVGEVTVRAVTRYELLTAGKGVNDEKQADVMDRRMLVAGVVEPALTMADAEEWQKCSPAGEIGRVLHRIRELSGLVEGAPKSGV